MHSLLGPFVHRELKFSNWFTEVGLCAGFVGEATNGVFADGHGSSMQKEAIDRHKMKRSGNREIDTKGSQDQRATIGSGSSKEVWVRVFLEK